MPTIGEVYDPLIAAALNDDPSGHDLLKETGARIFEHNPDRCPDVEDGIQAARLNLGYYVQYHDEDAVTKVREFYDLNREQQFLIR